MTGAERSRRRVQRGLRFFPLDAGDGRPAGLAIDSHGALRMVEGADTVRQSLMTLLSTRPGERVMRPDYGCDLDALAFAPFGATTNTLAKLLVRRAIEWFEPRAQIHRLEVAADAGRSSELVITIVYAVRGEPGQDQIAFAVPTRPDEPQR